MTVTLFALGGFCALLDWVAVDRRLFRLEYLFKPLTLALLIAAAISADLGPAQPWVVAALAFGLLGDVALMVSSDGKTDAAFIAGLGSFLAGHVCYLVAFSRAGLHGIDLLAGILIAGGGAASMLPQVLRGAARVAGREFAAIVASYATVLAAMTVLAVGTGIVATAIGGVLFLASDTLIARERFVGAVRHGPVLIIISYHLAQFLIVLGLVQTF